MIFPCVQAVIREIVGDLFRILKKLLELFYRHRVIEKETLCKVAAHGHQILPLLLCLNAFRDHDHADHMRHGHHASHDGIRAAVPLVPAHKAYIRFKNIQADRVEHAETGGTGAEIVHQNTEAGIVQLVHRLYDHIRIVREGALRYFNTQQIRLNIVLFREIDDVLGNVIKIEVDATDIDRHRHRADASVLHLPQPATHFLPDIAVHGIDVPALFHGRHKLCRGNQLTAVYPAAQCLGAHNSAIPLIDLRLQVKEEFAVLEATLCIQHQHFRLAVPAIVLHVVEPEMIHIAALDVLQSRKRMIIHGHQRFLLIP